MLPANPLEIPILANLSPEERSQVLACMSPCELAPGSVLVREGDPGESLYIVASGEIEILKAMGTPEEHLLTVSGPGDIIGEVALLDYRGRRSASARARGPASVLQMTAEDFLQLMETHPALASQITRIISSRLHTASDATIRDLESKNRALAEAYRELQEAHAQIIEKEKLEKELDIARHIQLSMLPEQLPEAAGYTFGARMIAARWLGGDFYDLFLLDENRIAVVVGDVSDKGVPSALFMALTRSLLRAEALRADTPAHTLINVNTLLQDMTNSGLFVTVLFGVLDLRSGRFEYARAGHELPILIRAAGGLALIPTTTGTVLGILPEVSIDQSSLELDPGDILLLFSDGATDAINPRNELFGHARLARAMQNSPRTNGQAVCDYLLDAIITHQGTAPQFDDITLVAICANSPKSAQG